MNTKNILFITFLFIYSFVVNAQSPAPNRGRGQEKFKFFKTEKTYIKNPFELRDPFRKVSIKLKSRAKVLRGNKVVFSNVPKIDQVPIESIRIVGIFLGNQRRAMARVLDGDKLGEQTFMLKEGMKLGLNNAELKAILPGGIVLVEKIRNVYDQDEYLETIIPVHDQ